MVLGNDKKNLMFQRLRLASVALGEFFSARASFSVPAFQRPFDWGPDEALQLLEDVSRAAGIELSEQADPDYFLGTVLLLTEEGNPLPGASAAQQHSGSGTFQIIDGQQRLTTLTMLFALLRDMAAASSFEDQDEVVAMLASLIVLPRVANDDATPISTRYRIVLNSLDRALFQTYVQVPGGTLTDPDSAATNVCSVSSKLLAARETLKANLEQLSPEQRLRLSRYLVEKCHLVVTLSHDLERAHRLFTVLNERGKPLRRNDIIKVEVLGGLPPQDCDYVRRHWEAAEQTLGEDFETFFTHLKVMHGRRRGRVVEGLRSLINAAGGGRKFVDDMLDPYAEAFAKIQSCASAPIPENDALALHLFYLNRLRGQEWHPAVLAALRTCADDPEAIRRLTLGIDRVAYVTRVLCHGSGRRVTRFARIVQAILSGEARDETADVFSFTRDEVRNVKFHLRNLYRRNPPVCKLLLMRINDRIEGRVCLQDPKALSVEHVLPNWPATASRWRNLFAQPEIREAATQCLGNYTLLPDKLNDRMRNREFSDKQEQIADFFSGELVMAIVADVMDSQSWDYPTIVARERKFLDILGEIIGIDMRDAGINEGRNAAE